MVARIGDIKISRQIYGQAAGGPQAALGRGRTEGDEVDLAEDVVGVGAIRFRGGACETTDPVQIGAGNPQGTGDAEKKRIRGAESALARVLNHCREVGLTEHAIRVGSIGEGGGRIETEDAAIVEHPEAARIVAADRPNLGKAALGDGGGGDREIRLPEDGLCGGPVREGGGGVKTEHAVVTEVGDKNLSGGGIDRDRGWVGEGCGRCHAKPVVTLRALKAGLAQLGGGCFSTAELGRLGRSCR